MSQVRKTALITGSGQNIGRGIAHELAKAGHNIVVNGSTNLDAAEAVAAEVRAIGVDASVAMGNVGIREDAELIVRKAVRHFWGHRYPRQQCGNQTTRALFRNRG